MQTPHSLFSFITENKKENKVFACAAISKAHSDFSMSGLCGKGRMK
jgi:hypothetical protein